MKKTLSWLSQLGIKPEYPLYFKKRVKISNRYYVGSILMFLTALILNLFTGIHQMSFLLLGWMLVSIICLIINKYGFVNFSRLLFIFIANAAIVIIAFIFGKEAMMSIHLFSIVVLTFLFFEIKEIKQIVFSLICVIAAFVLTQNASSLTFFHYEFDENYLHLLVKMNLLIGLLLTTIYLAYLVKGNDELNRKLENEREINLSIINASKDEIYLLDKNLKMLSYNIKAVNVLKDRYKYDLTKNNQPFIVLKDIGFDKQMEDWKLYFQRALAGEAFVEVITKTDFYNDTYFNETIFSPIKVKDGINGVAVYSRDITDRKNAETELLKYRSLTNQSTDFVLITSAHSANILDANDTVCKELGYSYSEIKELSMTQVSAIFTTTNKWKDFVKVLKTEGSALYETQYKCKDQSLFPVEVSARLAQYDGQEYVMIVARDIVKRKKYEEELITQREYLNQIINKSPNLLWVKDKDGKYILANKAIADLYHTTPQDMIGKSDADFDLKKEEVNFYHNVDREVFSNLQMTKSFEEAFTDPITKKTTWFHIIKTPITFGDETQLLGIGVDISKRKILEQEISALNSLQKAIINGTNQSVISMDLNGLITSFNKRSEELLGYKSEEAIGNLNIVHLFDKAEFEDFSIKEHKKIGKTISEKFEFLTAKANAAIEDRRNWTFKTQKGNIIMSCILNKLYDKEGHSLGYLMVSTDITEKLKLEAKIKIAQQVEKQSAWINTGLAGLNEILQKNVDNGNPTYEQTLKFIINYLNLHEGILFRLTEIDSRSFKVIASVGKDENTLQSTEIESLIHEVAISKTLKIVEDFPQKTNIIKGAPLLKNLILIPLLFEGETKGVLVLCNFNRICTDTQEFLKQVDRVLGSHFDWVLRDEVTNKLLKDSQELNEMLKLQEEKLRLSNEKLIKNSELLNKNKESLIASNKQIEEKANQLQSQNAEIRKKNEDLENARVALKLKADELEQSNRFKSEFLANVSHELRTPLNSILILSNLLLENKDNSLGGKQLDFAKVIHKSGSDLLKLINDVLDLAKIEAGKLDIVNEEFGVTELVKDIKSMFEEVAKEKGLNFIIELAPNAPQTITSDKMRIEQIIRNLLSNAFKFTSEGQVILEIKPEKEKNILAFNIIDTGIGLTSNQQQHIFEAFRQADGTTTRKFGGTGLGLSISKELTALLGATLELNSIYGKGSTFSLKLPLSIEEKQISTVLSVTINNNELPNAEDLTATLPKKVKVIQNDNSKKVILIIEDDLQFGGVLGNLVSKNNFIPLYASSGKEGLKKAREIKPDAILLDIFLPDLEGWDLLNILKNDKATFDIPVHIMSTTDFSNRTEAENEFILKTDNMNSFDKLLKKITSKIKSISHNILIIEDHKDQADVLFQNLEDQNHKCTLAYTGESAIEILKTHTFDLVILDYYLPDMNGDEVLKYINTIKEKPKVFIYTAKNYEDLHQPQLNRKNVIQKGGGNNDVLMHEVLEFFESIDNKNRKILENEIDHLMGKKILLVDDDMRNIFALTNVLNQNLMEVIVANDGREALKKLDENPDIDLVLMDIMMPEMNGHEATKEIRKNENFKNLPIIALTAKAMKGDREICLKAGASDYLAKPVDTNILLSLMRVWVK